MSRFSVSHVINCSARTAKFPWRTTSSAFSALSNFVATPGRRSPTSSVTYIVVFVRWSYSWDLSTNGSLFQRLARPTSRKMDSVLEVLRNRRRDVEYILRNEDTSISEVAKLKQWSFSSLPLQFPVLIDVWVFCSDRIRSVMVSAQRPESAVGTSSLIERYTGRRSL